MSMHFILTQQLLIIKHVSEIQPSKKWLFMDSMHILLGITFSLFHFITESKKISGNIKSIISKCKTYL